MDEALSAFDGVAAPDGVDAEMDDDACAAVLAGGFFGGLGGYRIDI